MDKIRKCIVATVAITFTLIFCLSISFAWFSYNRQVEAVGMNVSFQKFTGASIESYEIYKRDGKTNTAGIASSSSNPRLIEMTEYDKVFTDRNVNTPLVIRVVIKDVPETHPTITISINATGSFQEESNGKMVMKEYFSNIIGGDCAQISELDKYTFEHPEEIYSGVIDYFDALAAANPSYKAKGFVDYTVEFDEVHSRKIVTTNSKSSNLTIAIDDYDLNTDGKLVLYLKLDYIVDLVDAYVDQNGIQINETGLSDTVSFAYDLEPFALNYLE